MYQTCITFIKENQFECLLLIVAAVLALNILFLAYLVHKPTEQVLIDKKDPDTKRAKEAATQKKCEKETSESITVDISGSVVHPGAYEVASDVRLSQVLTKAGGLNSLADKDFFARNYNSASRLVDQQKIYVPRIDEVKDGIFVENAYSIDHAVCIYGDENEITPKSQEGSDEAQISINSASEQELDALPNIGPVTAKKVVDGRPYDSLEKLVELKILSQKVFDDLEKRLKL